MRIYISLPVSGHDHGKTREKADLLKATLSRQGHRAVSPFDLYPGRNPTYADYVCYGLLSMLSCDAVLFCRGWEQSCGCSIAHDVAMRLKAHGRKELRIMYE